MRVRMNTLAWVLGALLISQAAWAQGGPGGFEDTGPLSLVHIAASVVYGMLGLGFAMAVLVFRHAMQRDLPVQPDWLNRLLLLWIVVGAGRIIFDVRAYGFVALRDFATVYYACFFFIEAVFGESVAGVAVTGAGYRLSVDENNVKISLK